MLLCDIIDFFKLFYLNAPCILCIHVPVCTLQLDTKAFPLCTYVRNILTPFSLITNGVYKQILSVENGVMETVQVN